MNPTNRKFFLIVAVAIVICIMFLLYQLSVAEKININKSRLPLISPTATEIPIDPTDVIIGNQGAPLTITAFLDFNDAESRGVYVIVSDFIAANPLKMRMVFKDFPDLGLFADKNTKPHIAAYCAQKKNKFAEYAYALSKLDGKTTDNDVLDKIADQAGLVKDVWRPCLSSTEAKTRVESSISLAKAIGLKKAPAIFINNKLVNYITEINLNDLLKEIIRE